MINKIDKIIDKIDQLRNEIDKFLRSSIVIKIFIKIVCLIVIPFYAYIFSCILSYPLSHYCIKALNFIMQVEFFELPDRDIYTFYGIFLIFYPICVVCYYALSILFYIYSILKKKITRTQYSLNRYLHFCIFIIIMVVLMYLISYTFNTSEYEEVILKNTKSSIILTSFLMSIIAYMKIYCIDKNKYGTFAIISIGEIVVPIIFAIVRLYIKKLHFIV